MVLSWVAISLDAIGEAALVSVTYIASGKVRLGEAARRRMVAGHRHVAHALDNQESDVARH